MVEKRGEGDLQKQMFYEQALEGNSRVRLEMKNKRVKAWVPVKK